MRRTSVIRALMGVLAVCTFCACSSTTTGSSNTAPTPTPSAAPGATPSATSSTAFAREATSPDPNFDTGYTVQITPTGFHPAWLIAPCCQAVTWRNMTNAPVSVVFNAVAGGSGQSIPPSGTYVFVPANIESIAYHDGASPSMKGVVQVNQLPE